MQIYDDFFFTIYAMCEAIYKVNYFFFLIRRQFILSSTVQRKIVHI